MSIEILASKLPDVMGTYRHLSHTVLSCIVSCVHTSEQDVWCWWPWLTRTTSGNWVIWGCMTKWLRFFTFFFENPKKTWLFTFSLRGCTRDTFSRTLRAHGATTKHHVTLQGMYGSWWHAPFPSNVATFHLHRSDFLHVGSVECAERRFDINIMYWYELHFIITL